GNNQKPNINDQNEEWIFTQEGIYPVRGQSIKSVYSLNTIPSPSTLYSLHSTLYVDQETTTDN
ncbi:MAG: hypothetical protein K9I85_15960, partial [Saprospiraceae bacterium]|nr:hypothetical protein [Saprospiraceae bacterium]